MRVLKGKKLPGHLGNETVTIQNLEIISVDVENNCLLISGNIPGAKGGYVLIRTAIKGGKNNAADLVSYVVEEEPVVENTEAPATEEVVEETANEEVKEEVAETTEEEVKEAE
jgi:large subunit ribosomal protein L3